MASRILLEPIKSGVDKVVLFDFGDIVASAVVAANAESVLLGVVLASIRVRGEVIVVVVVSCACEVDVVD